MSTIAAYAFTTSDAMVQVFPASFSSHGQASRQDEDIDLERVVWDAEYRNEVKHRLLNGLDDIGITLENDGAIDRFEAGPAGALGPVTTSL